MIGQAAGKKDIHVGIDGDALGLVQAINQARKAISKLKSQGFTDLDFLNFQKTDFKPDKFLDINEFKKQAQMFGKQVDDSFKTIKSPAKKPYIDPTVIPQKQIDEGLQNLDKAFNVMDKDALKSQESFDKMGKIAGENLSKISNESQNSVIKFRKLKNQLMPFPGYAMSIMFLGMAMQRMFTTISKFGVSAFQEIMHSVEGSTTQFDYLNGTVKYLGFTIGQALEPVAAWLIPIVIATADWVSENQSLVRWFIIIGAALGTLAFVGGMWKLAMAGIVGAMLEFILVLFGGEAAILALKKGIIKVIALKLRGWFVALGTYIKTTLYPILVKIILPLLGWIAAIALLIFFFYMMRGVWDNVAKGFMLKAELMGIRFKLFGQILKKGIENLKYIFKIGWEYIKLGFFKFLNLSMAKFGKWIQTFIDWLNRVIAAWNRIFGASIQRIPDFVAPQFDTTSIEHNIFALEADWFNTIAAIDKEIWELEKLWDENVQKQVDNANDAWNQLKSNWSDFLDWFSNNQPEIEVESDVFGKEPIPGYTTEEELAELINKDTDTKYPGPTTYNTYVNIDTIELPSVTTGEDFIQQVYDAARRGQ
jgi:hypothetical protein